MFTGIIQAVGSVAGIGPRDGDLRLTLDVSALVPRVDTARLAIGESIAVDGVCLTVTQFDGTHVAADVSAETLGLTTLGSLRRGQRTNLECALRLGDPLGGHIVSGHVDGIAAVVSVASEARSVRVVVEAPAALARLIAPKGSVALDGVSLTVNEVDGSRFGVNLIPHTLAATTLQDLAPGRMLNLEVDPLARYVQRALGTG